MRIIVTGGFGFIGSEFIRLASKHGHTLLNVDARTYAARVENLVPMPKGMIGTVTADICEANTIHTVFSSFNPHALVNFAAETHVGRSIADREAFLRSNVIGVDVLLNEACRYMRLVRNPDFKFLQVSTDEVFGSLKGEQLPWSESAPYAPNNPYAASKAAADHMVRAYAHTFRLQVVITHGSNTYGPAQHPEKLIPTLTLQAAAGQPMTLHGDGLNIRDWLHVSNHAEGILRALEFGMPGATYNFGGGCERTNLDIARMVWSALQEGEPKISFIEDRPGNDLRYGLDFSAAARDLAWSPGPLIETQIAEVARWYAKNPYYKDEYGC
jgi:dTDP-glucose 4,6-dehydratase